MGLAVSPTITDGSIFIRYAARSMEDSEGRSSSTCSTLARSESRFCPTGADGKFNSQSKGESKFLEPKLARLDRS